MKTKRERKKRVNRKRESEIEIERERESKREREKWLRSFEKLPTCVCCRCYHSYCILFVFVNNKFSRK